MTPAPRGVAAEPERRAAARARLSGGLGHRLRPSEVPTWTGQAAAHGGHAGLAEVEQVFSTFVYHILVGRALLICLRPTSVNRAVACVAETLSGGGVADHEEVIPTHHSRATGGLFFSTALSYFDYAA